MGQVANLPFPSLMPDPLLPRGVRKLPPAVYPKSHAGNSLRIQTESDDLGLCLVADDPGHLFQVSPFLERAKPRSGGPVVLIARTAVDLSGLDPELQKKDPAQVAQLIRVGYIWLFATGGVILVRLLLDPVMVRRPLLEPNLNASGLTFTGVALLVFLMANIITSPKERLGPKERLEYRLAVQAQHEAKPLADPGFPPYQKFADFPNQVMVASVSLSSPTAPCCSTPLKRTRRPSWPTWPWWRAWSGSAIGISTTFTPAWPLRPSACWRSTPAN